MDRNKIAVIQKQIQFENDCFDRLIIALERLETFLVNERRGMVDFAKTVVGTPRDLHDDVKQERDKESYIEEVEMQCSTVYMCAHYQEEEISKIAIESFLTDILEWYAGRSLNSDYDTVDLCIIPILNALTRKSSDVESIFEKYVHKPSEIDESDKMGAMQNALETYILATDIAERQADEKSEEREDLIVRHNRGEALEGYKYLVKVLTTVCESSTPVKMLIHTVQEFLPEVSDALPAINDDSVDKLFDSRLDESDKKKKEDSGLSYDESLERVSRLLYEIAEVVLKNEGIEYKEINIKII